MPDFPPWAPGAYQRAARDAANHNPLQTPPRPPRPTERATKDAVLQTSRRTPPRQSTETTKDAATQTSPRTPLNAIENNAIVTDLEAPREPLGTELYQAINIAEPEKLRGILIALCKLNAVSRYLVEDRPLPLVEEVVLQYADSSSEEGSIIFTNDRECSKNAQHDGNEASNNEDEDVHNRENFENAEDSAIWLSSENYNFPVCENCSMAFNPNANIDGTCVWYEDWQKIVNEEAESGPTTTKIAMGHMRALRTTRNISLDSCGHAAKSQLQIWGAKSANVRCLKAGVLLSNRPLLCNALHREPPRLQSARIAATTSTRPQIKLGIVPCIWKSKKLMKTGFRGCIMTRIDTADQKI
ncbi:uncharacterized protein PAC_19259 [Phialocephala subalpina]|uniref:Uncharacterized protein n=1 Tax=Phialocephala subalpina TaxID=576137 RepID=A0A1L7XWJ4_9HELO|nr:uncharacterized protein PAC_19259 [Phialocephala subalpina]